ncbi:MAG: hypothetical protein ACLUAR_14770 [Pilosibacter sp.]
MLSGGNIQKVVVAREFTSGSNFILANQPTRGIDVGAAEMIRKTIVKKSREEGTATLLNLCGLERGHWSVLTA